jgi:hypothetical protein
VSPLATRPVPARDRLRPTRVLAALAGVAVAVALVVTLAPALRTESPVARLTFDNPTVYSVNVEVSDGAGGGWLDLGAVERGRSKTVEEVTDQGARWLFRFSYGGVDAGELAVSRADLAGGGWRMSVPEAAGQRLRDAGLAPSAA